MQQIAMQCVMNGLSKHVLHSQPDVSEPVLYVGSCSSAAHITHSCTAALLLAVWHRAMPTAAAPTARRLSHPLELLPHLLLLQLPVLVRQEAGGNTRVLA